MSRWCEPGRHSVPDHEAQPLRRVVTGSGLGAITYGCHEHIRDRGLVPAPGFIGHRSKPPEHAPRPA